MWWESVQNMKIALTVSFEAHLRKYLPFFYCSTVCTKKMAWGIEQCCRQFLEICHMVLLCSSCLSILQIVKTAELFLRGHEYLNRFLIPLRRFKFLSLGGTKKNSTTVWNRFKRHFKKLLGCWCISKEDQMLLFNKDSIIKYELESVVFIFELFHRLSKN